MLLDILTAEGDTIEGGGSPAPEPAPTPSPTPTPTPAPAPAPTWYSSAESLKTSDPQTWSTFEKGIQSGAHKDFPTFVKNAVNLEKKLGSALFFPDKNSPEATKEFRDKLTKAGYLPTTPGNPDGYEVKLDAVPEKLRSDNLVSEFRKIAHEEGLSQSAVSKLAGLYEHMFTTEVEPALKYTQEQGQQAIINTARELGIEPNIAEQFAGSWLAKRFTDEEMAGLERIGAANSPELLKYAILAGRDTGEDISVGDGAALPDAEVEDILSVRSNPNHPMRDLYLKGNTEDPKRIAFMEKLNAAERKKFGVKEVE